MLTEQGPELYQLILSKMQDLLTSTDVDDALSSQLVRNGRSTQWIPFF